jgi:hypothetical protein
MKHLKIFEEYIDKPQLNDYIICKADALISIPKYLENHIGKIIEIQNNNMFDVVYKDLCVGVTIPNHNDETHWVIPIYDIIHWSKDPKELEIYIAQSKYNI